MDEKNEKPSEGVIAQGRHLHGQIRKLCTNIEKYIWPASADDAEAVLVLHQNQHDYLKAFLLSSDKSFSSNQDQITSITGIGAKIVISSSIPTPDVFVKPKES